MVSSSVLNMSDCLVARAFLEESPAVTARAMQYSESHVRRTTNVHNIDERTNPCYHRTDLMDSPRSDDPNAPPPTALSHRQVLIVFAAVLTGMFLSALDQTIVSTSLPTIVGELGGLQHLSWVITAYLLTSTASMPLYGKLSDIYGRKLLFQAAIGIFLAGSLLSGAAQSMEQLIIFRGIQGIGAGGIMTMAQAIIGDIVSPRERGRYTGYMGGVFALSSVLGPLLGGLFTDHLSWRWVFYINLPIGGVALLVTAIVLRIPFERKPHKIDYLGSMLMMSGISALLLVTTWGGNQYGWLSPTIIILGVFGGLSLLGFVLQEQRAPEPLLPLRLFREPVFAIGNLIGFVVGLAMFGALAFLPVYLQVVKGASATGSGLRLIPMMLGLIVASIISGRIISSTGRYRVYPIVGTAFVAAGLYLLSRLTVASSTIEVSIYMLVLGIGVGLVMQVVVLAVQNSVDYPDLGVATAGANLFRSLGSAFGVAIFGSILNNKLDYHLQRLVSPDALNGISTAALTSSPAAIARLPDAVRAGVLESFALSLQTVFLWAIPVALIGFVAAWFLPEHPLRSTVHIGNTPAPEPPPVLPAENADATASAG